MKSVRWLVFGSVVAIIAMYAVSSFNGLVGYDENVKRTYAQVQIVMQRMANLIPNLVETVRAAAGHENKTLTQVSEARSRLTAVAKMDPKELASNPELQKQLVEAQTAMSQAMVSLNAVKEAYPQLQANENFRTLMTELAGSENRIANERRNNQKAVEVYNGAVRSFPRAIIARWGGFEPRPYFEADETGQKTPQVKF